MRFRDVFYDSADGLRLQARIHGEENPGLPVVCLPGLTRNARDFDALAKHLVARGRRVIAFTYRGRGSSAYADDWKTYSVVVEAGDVVDGLAALGIGRAAFIGTSRGGLILHLMAATRLDLIAAIVLNDIGPVVEAEGLQHIVGYLGCAKRKPLTDFAEAAAQQHRIHGEAFPALGDADWLRMAHALYRQDEDGVVPDFDPALLNTLAYFDPARPMPTLWPQFDAMRGLPVMVIRGENSTLLSAETVAEMAARHPALVSVTAHGQGHAPFLETADLAERIGRFLDQAS